MRKSVEKKSTKNRAEYDRRVKYMYDFLAKHGVPIDRANSNPSRMTRLPGVTRKGKCQTLVAVNVGLGSWKDWENYADNLDSDLPEAVALSEYENKLPSLPAELIGGILREGHKMLIAGPSKAGKSFLLMQLCIAIAEGFLSGFAMERYHLYEHISGAIVQTLRQGRNTPGL